MTLEECTPGLRVEWLMEHNKGWGGGWWVPAVIVRINRVKVAIAAQKQDGSSKVVNVRPDKLRRAALIAWARDQP